MSQMIIPVVYQLYNYSTRYLKCGQGFRYVVALPLAPVPAGMRADSCFNADENLFIFSTVPLALGTIDTIPLIRWGHWCSAHLELTENGFIFRATTTPDEIKDTIKTCLEKIQQYLNTEIL